MNRQISVVAGRSPARRTRCRLEYFDGLLKLRDLAAQLPVLPIGRDSDPVALPSVDLGLADPLTQHLRTNSDASSDRPDAGVLAVVLVAVLNDQTDSLGLHGLVVFLRHDAAYLPSKEGVH